MARSTKKTSDDTPEINDTPQTEISVDGSEVASGATPEGVTDAEIIENLDGTPSSAEPLILGAAEQASDENSANLVPERRRPGFLPLFLGGIVAAGIGYGAAFFGFMPVAGGDGPSISELTAQIERQSTALAAQADLVASLGAQVSNLPSGQEPVDLGPITDDLTRIATETSAMALAQTAIEDRISTLEARPILTGDGTGTDGAAMAAAMAQMQSALDAQQAENTALAQSLQEVATASESRITAAEERAAANVETATARAALSQLRIAVAAGDPFAQALDDLEAGTGQAAPDALRAAAETGVPTLEELQSQFPAAARAALPVALRETAGDSTMERVGAFLLGQVGGRSLEPQEGDDPDAVLSRAEADIRTGNLATTLAEIATLPEPAQVEFASWIDAAQTRLAATEALDTFAAALDTTN
jgi:hypothetical protein